MGGQGHNQWGRYVQCEAPLADLTAYVKARAYNATAPLRTPAADVQATILAKMTAVHDCFCERTPTCFLGIDQVNSADSAAAAAAFASLKGGDVISKAYALGFALRRPPPPVARDVPDLLYASLAHIVDDMPIVAGANSVFNPSLSAPNASQLAQYEIDVAYAASNGLEPPPFPMSAAQQAIIKYENDVRAANAEGLPKPPMPAGLTAFQWKGKQNRVQRLMQALELSFDPSSLYTNPAAFPVCGPWDGPGCVGAPMAPYEHAPFGLGAVTWQAMVPCPESTDGEQTLASSTAYSYGQAFSATTPWDMPWTDLSYTRTGPFTFNYFTLDAPLLMGCANSKAVSFNYFWHYLANAIFNGRFPNVGEGAAATRFTAFALNSGLGGLAFDGNLQCASFVMYEGESQQVCVPTDHAPSEEVGQKLYQVKASTAGYY
jgi:hypothetical protein